MFYYLKGTAVQKTDSILVLDIGGVGFKVHTSLTTLSQISLNTEVTVFTYTYVREDALEIFGFKTEDELTFFLKLISISGVGPRLALAILSTHSTQDILMSILSGDSKTLSKAPGVGQKLAQRIILELKDKIKNEEIQEAVVSQPNQNTQTSEAVNALMVLGYSEGEARKAVADIPGDLSLEDTIKKALVSLMR